MKNTLETSGEDMKTTLETSVVFSSLSSGIATAADLSSSNMIRANQLQGALTRQLQSGGAGVMEALMLAAKDAQVWPCSSPTRL